MSITVQNNGNFANIARPGMNGAISGGANRISTATAASFGGVSANSTDSVDVKSQTPNPYTDLGADIHSERVVAQPWTSNRKNSNGDDHLVGMLKNRGFTDAEIYAKDSKGRTLFDRVAVENGLRSPHKIRAGQSYILPSKNAPEQEFSQEVKVSDTSTGHGANASSTTHTDAVELSKAGLAATHSATSTSNNSVGNNTASQVSNTNVGSINEATATVGTQAIADQDTSLGNNNTQAESNAQVKTMDNARLELQTQSEANIKNSVGDNSANSDSNANIEEMKSSETEAKTTAAANSSNSFGNNMATASNVTGVGSMEQAGVNTKVTSTASSEGSIGTNKATSTGATIVEDAEGSSIQSQTDAGAISADSVGLNAAESENNAVVIKANNTNIVSNSNAASLSQNSEGNTAAQATATTAADAIANTASETNADATAVKAEGSGGAYAQTEAKSAYGSAVNSDLSTNATATGSAEPEQKSMATARTETRVETAKNLNISDNAIAAADDAAAIQSVAVNDNRGGVHVNMNAEAGTQGTVNQVATVDGPSSDARVEMRATGANVQQTAIAANETAGSPQGTTWEGNANPSVRVESNGAKVANPEISGFRTATEVANQAELAPMGNDAQYASYEGQGNGSVIGYHEGQNGTVNIGVQAEEKIFFQDGAAGRPVFAGSTGNSVTGQVESKDIRVDTTASKDFNGTLVGTEGNDRHEVRLNANGANNVVANQGGGEDFFVAQTGQGDIGVTKTDGTMNLAINTDNSASQRVVLDAGNAAIRGNVDLRDADQATVDIRTGGAAHDATIRGGNGSNDTIRIHVSGDDAAPRVVTREGSNGFFGLGAKTELGAASANSEGVIKAPGFENVVIVRDGQVEAQYGADGRPVSFAAAQAAVQPQ